MNPVFDYGDLIRISGVFLNSNGSAVIDPANVYVQVNTEATGITTTYTYGLEGVVIRDSMGNYHADIDTAESSGNWFWRVFSRGTGQAAEEGKFYVRPRQF